MGELGRLARDASWAAKEKDGRTTEIGLEANVDYDGTRGSLMTTVTLSAPELLDVSALKLIMEEGMVYGVNINEDETPSLLYGPMIAHGPKGG